MTLNNDIKLSNINLNQNDQQNSIVAMKEHQMT
jgi:hypothetical protein